VPASDGLTKFASHARASTANNAASLTELETIVRIALADLCGNH
jgi:hypothetical protein